MSRVGPGTVTIAAEANNTVYPRSGTVTIAGKEGLKGSVPGLVDIRVNISGLASSNADMMLDSTFESEAALKGYAVHPAHVAVANAKVRPFTETRLCLDYEV